MSYADEFKSVYLVGLNSVASSIAYVIIDIFKSHIDTKSFAGEMYQESKASKLRRKKRGSGNTTLYDTGLMYDSFKYYGADISVMGDEFDLYVNFNIKLGNNAKSDRGEEYIMYHESEANRYLKYSLDSSLPNREVMNLSSDELIKINKTFDLLMQVNLPDVKYIHLSGGV